MRIEDHSLFPSLQDTQVLFWEGNYLELEPSPTPVTLIPPGQFGPPDKVSTLDEITNKPGLILKNMGKGKVAYIPWDIGELYYKHSNDKHRILISDILDHLVIPWQIMTDAHPTVEITVMDQPKTKETMVHLINLSGHSGTAFFEAIEMEDITIEIKGEYSKAFSIDGKEEIPLEVSDNYTKFIINKLTDYIVVCLVP
jgi:hypothetical protein